MSLTLLQPFNIDTNSVFTFANNKIKITGGSVGQALTTDGTGNLIFAAAGSAAQVQAAYDLANSDFTTLTATAGTFGSSSAIPVVTLLANGRVSGITTTSITIPAGTSVYGNTGQITTNTATGIVALGLATTTVVAGTYSSANVTIDAYGRITAAANGTSSGGGGGGAAIPVTNDTTTNSNAYYPLLSTINTGTLSAANTSSSALYFNPSTGTLNSTIFNSLSDENVKTNRQKITEALVKMSQLGGYTYMLIDSGEVSAGLLAQEVQKVLPEAVKYNEEHNLLTLNYNAVLGLVVESINALEQRVKELENNGKL